MTTDGVIKALAAVMADVHGVAKRERNTQQGFSFRGVDAVVNAVGPALRKHGVIVVPLAEDIQHEAFTTGKGTPMRSVTLRVRWRFYGPAGDSIDAVSYGEAADAGDKAVPKAHSVAYRTVLLQALCIPTDEPDPDAYAYERPGATPPPAPPVTQPPTNAVAAAKAAVWRLAQHRGWDLERLGREYAGLTGGLLLADADDGDLRNFLGLLEEQA